MLPRAHRGLKRSDFNRIYKSGKTLKTAFFRIKTAPMEVVEVKKGLKNRFGVVISGKTLKGAVSRNRLRRQIFAIFREIEPLLLRSAFIVVVPEPQAKDANFSELKADLITGLIKIGFLDPTIQT